MASPAFIGARPQRARVPTYNRDSNALRASVLDVALQLGVGTSRAVENLIFDSFPEEEEEEENELVTTPPLTSASVATSDESWPSVPTWGGIPNQFVMPVRKPSNATPALNSGIQAVRSPSEDSHLPMVPLPHQPRKLRKARKDGYESDAGYPSDNMRGKKGPKKGSLSTFEGEFPSDLFEATKKGGDKKKDKEKKLAAEPSTRTSNKSTKKTRTSSDDGDHSDRGYQSEASTKKKKTFFRLRSRSPSVARKGMPSDGTSPPPVPALPTMPLPISPHFTRTPTPFSWLDGISLNSATTLRPAHSPVPSSVDGHSVLTSSIPSKDSSPPPSDRTATRSLSIDTTSDSLIPSTTSHEIGPRGLSPAILSKQTPMSAPAAVLPHDVRFASSKRFGSSDILFPISQSSPAITMTSGKLPPRPNTSPSTTSHPPKASPSPIQPSIVPPISRSSSPMFPPSDVRPFISRTLRPSPLQLTPSTSPPLRAVSPSLSQSSIVSSSDYILPSPRPRFFEDLPPPSPPPTCPLPELPSSSPYQPPVPLVQRGRQSPFPVRSAFPIQDSSSVHPTKRIPQAFSRVRFAGEMQEEEKVTTTATTVGNGVRGDAQDDVQPGLVEGVTVVPPSPYDNQTQEDDTDWPDHESVRPYMTQFYSYGLPSRSFGVGEILPRPWPDDERHSTSTFQQLAASSTTNTRASAMPSSSAEMDIYSYYFEELDQDQDRDGGDSERRSHASFVDDGHRREMRTRLSGIGYADATYGAETIPPVPKIRPF